jgi:hypothetical protein
MEPRLSLVTPGVSDLQRAHSLILMYHIRQ